MAKRDSVAGGSVAGPEEDRGPGAARAQKTGILDDAVTAA